MAERTGLSKLTVGRIWKSFELKPHRAEGFKLSNDPLFIEKVHDVVGLYLNPPEAAVVLNIVEGTVIRSLHRRHRAIEFEKFLTKIDSQVPENVDVHLICDNYSTHKSPSVVKWLHNHPRFHMHFTATYSSWINQVERFFAHLTADLLQRSDHRSVQALEADIRNWVKAWNDNSKPFIWTKIAEQILSSLARLLQPTTGAEH